MNFKYKILRNIFLSDSIPLLSEFQNDYYSIFDFIIEIQKEIDCLSSDSFCSEIISFIFYLARKNKKWRKDFCQENNIPQWRIIHLLDQNQKSKIPFSMFLNILNSENGKYKSDDHIKNLLIKLFNQKMEIN